MIRVFLADDHPIVRTGLKALLSLADDISVVGEAVDGRKVLLAAESPEWAVDVLVLDISLPKVNGIEVLRRLQQTRPELPVLMLSMYSEDQYARRMIDMGAAGYVSKDRSEEELISAIRAVAHGGLYISRRAARGPSPTAAAGLTPRQHQVFTRLVEGQSVTDIAAELKATRPSRVPTPPSASRKTWTPRSMASSTAQAKGVSAHACARAGPQSETARARAKRIDDSARKARLPVGGCRSAETPRARGVTAAPRARTAGAQKPGPVDRRGDRSAPRPAHPSKTRRQRRPDHGSATSALGDRRRNVAVGGRRLAATGSAPAPSASSARAAEQRPTPSDLRTFAADARPRPPRRRSIGGETAPHPSALAYDRRPNGPPGRRGAALRRPHRGDRRPARHRSAPGAAPARHAAAILRRPARRRVPLS